jgi:hypothetical protein
MSKLSPHLISGGAERSIRPIFKNILTGIPVTTSDLSGPFTRSYSKLATALTHILGTVFAIIVLFYTGYFPFLYFCIFSVVAQPLCASK